MAGGTSMTNLGKNSFAGASILVIGLISKRVREVNADDQISEFSDLHPLLASRQQAVEPLSNEYWRARKRAQDSAITGLKNLDLGRFLRQMQVYVDNDRLIEAAKQWQLMEDLDWKHKKEITDFESEITRVLTTISQTSIGSMVLHAINRRSKVWIIPAIWANPTAITHCTTEAEGGGIRIHFDPKRFRRVTESPTVVADGRESTLLHELVHAMRFSTGRFARKPIVGARQVNFPDSEEFIATQIENIYRGSRRQNDLYDPYRGEILMRKEKMYQWLAEDAELVMFLKYFLDTEPVAKNSIALKQPEYNPFRDYKQIASASHKLYGLSEFLDIQ